MEGEELPKKSGFKGKQAKRKFSCNIERGADQKVSTTQQSDELQQSQVAEVANPLVDMVASKAAARKHTKSELVGALKRAKVDIDQATQQLDARKRWQRINKNWPWHGTRQQRMHGKGRGLQTVR